MITSFPLGRRDLRIKHSDKVLEIGSGHNPMYRSNVLVDKYVHNNSHRCGDICIYPHQKFIEADGEHLPFKDKEFDYIICNQVLEHAEHPELFIAELMRVAPAGYLETPSMVGESMFPKSSHKWAVLILDNKIVMFEKEKMPGNFLNDYGELFLNYLPYQSLAFKILTVSEPNLMINRLEWKESVELIVNPTDEYYNQFFTKKWNREMTTKVYPPRSASAEIKRFIRSTCYLLTTMFTEKFIHRRKPMTIEQYMKQQAPTD